MITKKLVMSTKNLVAIISSAVALIILIIIIVSSITIIPAGHVGVYSLFGKVSSDTLDEGFHMRNPFGAVTVFDARQKTHKEPVGVPSQDQLITNFDISIQYRLIKSKASMMYKETGNPSQVIEVHMIPTLRSKVREIGKSVKAAEDFYQVETQQRLQTELLSTLSSLAEKGIQIDALLIRDITLPALITDAVERKKKASQEAEKAKEELKQFIVEQEKKQAQAEADTIADVIQADKQKQIKLIQASAVLEAARIEAQAVIVEAEAKKKAIELEVSATGVDNYIRLKSFDALKEFQKGNHTIFLDPNAHNVLPFMNIFNK